MSQRFSSVLLILGLMGTAIGLGMSGYSIAKDNPKMMTIGIYYLVASIAVLFIRQVVILIDVMVHERRHRIPDIQVKPGYGAWKSVAGIQPADEENGDDDDAGATPESRGKPPGQV